jgi:putative acetyltransferase
MHIRPMHAGEELALRAVFHSAVHGLASRDYTPEQIEAWAPSEFTTELQERWVSRVRGIQPFVVEFEGLLVAYADIQPSGYIDHFFVAAHMAGRGVGSVLMHHLHRVANERGISVLTSDVSRTAQPFFERFGFLIVAERTPIVRGIAVPNALMRKELQQATARH